MKAIREEINKDIKFVVMFSIFTSIIIILFLSVYPLIEINIKKNIDSNILNINKFSEMRPVVNYDSIVNYIAYMFDYIYIIAGIYGGALGACTFLDKKESNMSTNDYLVSKILGNIEKFLAYTLLIGMVTFVMIVLVTPMDGKIEYVLLEEVNLLIGLFIIGIFFMSIGFIISVVSKNKVMSIVISFVVVVYTYILGVVSRFSYKLEILKIFSPFENIKPIDIINYGYYGLVVFSIIITSICFILLTILAYKEIDERKNI
ncbi:hypothetical protein K5V21_04395 [Clostridium sardiniense]|uniref:ABC transporter permease n=1 Tax=Clostridium sardiniense TaxID=29369 RepID=A0ABS7KVK7_CLOSR|nr:hypothetical protein [Clostridium sardiniense]MBY0754692.1 hypothetical protein [Clostridium sardiniense]MDQ0460588.1 ABC-2 type transport system permease protein [Clostridium sardiniense]